MSYGVQIWDASGNLTLDISSVTLREYTPLAVTVPSSGTVDVTATGIAPTTHIAFVDNGAPAVVAANKVTVTGGSSTAGGSTLRIMMLR